MALFFNRNLGLFQDLWVDRGVVCILHDAGAFTHQIWNTESQLIEQIGGATLSVFVRLALAL